MFQKMTEVITGEQPFAGGDRDWALRRDFAKCLWTFAEHRLFDEQRFVRRNGTRKIESGADGKCLPHLKPEIETSFPDCFAFGNCLFEASAFCCRSRNHPLHS